MTIHVFFLFPETAGKPLEEVTEMFEDPSGPKYIGTPVCITCFCSLCTKESFR